MKAKRVQTTARRPAAQSKGEDMAQQMPGQGGYTPAQGQYAQQPVQQTQPGYAGPGNDFAAQASRFNQEHIASPETKEFFKTSEFVLWLVGCLGVLIASAAAPDVLDARGAWGLISTLSIAYIVSRGLAKAGTHRADWNYSDSPTYGTNPGIQAQINEHVATPETKEFFKTSEFVVWGITVIGILIASAIVDIFEAGSAWRYIAFTTGAYIVSRGLSKIGTRQDIGTQQRRAVPPSNPGYVTGPGVVQQQGQAVPGTVDLRGGAPVAPQQPVAPGVQGTGEVPPQQPGY